MKEHLGYDPRPELRQWKGTPIPPVDAPLSRTPARWAVAEWVWWNGPPWTVLRNGSQFLWSVMDHALPGHLRLMLREVPEERWRRALAEATPGRLSKGSYVYWSLAFDCMDLDAPCDWPDDAHVRDYRPLANESRARLYARHATRRGSPTGVGMDHEGWE